MPALRLCCLCLRLYLLAHGSSLSHAHCCDVPGCAVQVYRKALSSGLADGMDIASLLMLLRVVRNRTSP